jgi:hypothetical protein
MPYKDREKRRQYKKEWYKKRLRNDENFREKERERKKLYQYPYKDRKIDRVKVNKQKLDWYHNNPEEKKKMTTRFKLHYAVKSGKILKLPCEVCGNEKSEGHHDDYNKPFEVRWLCKKHHEEHHLRFPPT